MIVNEISVQLFEVKHIAISWFLGLISLSYAQAQTMDTLWIDTFEQDSLTGWHANKGDINQVYNLQSDSLGQHLAATSESSDLFIIKQCAVDLVEYPYLNWKWRAHVLPRDGNEFEKNTCDITASIYAVVRLSRWRPQSIKFTWSTTLKEGEYGTSPFSFWPARSDIKVVESGDANLGRWVNEKINLLEEYKKLYNKKNVKSIEIKAISIMTDSDNTKSSSSADYDDLFFSKQ